MSHPIYSLTSGSMEGTFDQAIASVQNYGFRQSLFEVERVSTAKSRAAGEKDFEEVLVLRPSSTQPDYSQMKPGDRVYCTGLRKDASGSPAICRIRRMAEGSSRTTMIEHRIERK